MTRRGCAIGVAVLGWGCLLALIPGRAHSGWQTYLHVGALGTDSCRSSVCDRADYVNGIAEDRRRNLWFATNAGVNRLGDGAVWTTFGTADGLPPGIGGDPIPIRCCLVDRAGNVWVGTGGGGVCRYNGTWRTFTTADGLGDNTVLSMLEDHEGNLWFGTATGATRFDGSAWRSFTAADGLPGGVAAMVEDGSGELWLGTQIGGLVRYDGSTWTLFTRAQGLTSNNIHCLAADRAGNLWVGTDQGLSRFDGTTWRTFSTSDGLPANWLDAVFADRDGNVWASVEFPATLCRYDGVSWRTFGQDEGADAMNPIVAITQDHVGNLWLGTQGTGIRRFDLSSSRVFSTELGSDPRAVSMMQDRAGSFWIGTGSGGVARYDGSSWRTFTTTDGLASNQMRAVVQDRSGAIWFATPAGVTRYDGTAWRTFTTADGLGSGDVNAILEDRSGNLWFGTSGGGATRYDGATWRTFTTADGLAENTVTCLMEDHLGNVWFGSSYSGASRYDGSTWRTFTTADGLASNYISAMLEDRSGDLWFGTVSSGICRFDGTSWATFTTADGMAGNDIRVIREDRYGNVLVGSSLVGAEGGLSRYDGLSWLLLKRPSDVGALLLDRAGDIWIGTAAGVIRYEPDRAAPWARFREGPGGLSSSRFQFAVAGAAFVELQGVEYSFRMDNEAWSEWSSLDDWNRGGIEDGGHALQVRIRDYLGNVDSTATSFDVDATPPLPVIASPSFGAPIRGQVSIRGTAADARFRSYRVEARPSGTAPWDSATSISIGASPTPVVDGVLADWNTLAVPDGSYDVRLAVTDSLGLVGLAQATMIVDNLPPYADQTSPTRVTAVSGGDVFTTNAEAHLYFPPHAFSEDAVVNVAPVDRNSEPDTLNGGVVLASPGYELSWSGSELRKVARMEMSLAGADPTASKLWAVYHSADGASWELVGGTVADGEIALPVTAPGRYAIYEIPGNSAGSGKLSGLELTPRIFSPSGGFADREVGISFYLGRSSSATVRVYSRGGRLIREVASGASFQAGSNLIRWDGRDRSGGVVPDGLYLVTVEALGQSEKKTLAIVR